MPRVGEQAAQLAHDHRQRLLPGRRRSVAPERLREFVPWHRSALLGHEVGEQEPTLPSREARLVDHDPVGLDCHPTRKENLQLNLLAFSCPHLACVSRRPPSLAARSRGQGASVRLRVRSPRRGRGRARRRSPAPRGEAHGMALSRDEALLLAFRAELDARADHAPSRDNPSGGGHDARNRFGLLSSVSRSRLSVAGSPVSQKAQVDEQDVPSKDDQPEQRRRRSEIEMDLGSVARSLGWAECRRDAEAP